MPEKPGWSVVRLLVYLKFLIILSKSYWISDCFLVMSWNGGSIQESMTFELTRLFYVINYVSEHKISWVGHHSKRLVFFNIIWNCCLHCWFGWLLVIYKFSSPFREKFFYCCLHPSPWLFGSISASIYSLQYSGTVIFILVLALMCNIY